MDEATCKTPNSDIAEPMRANDLKDMAAPSLT
jgi:hypothetical protein